MNSRTLRLPPITATLRILARILVNSRRETARIDAIRVMMRAMGEGRGEPAGRSVGYNVTSRDEFIEFYRDSIGPAYRAASRLAGGDRNRADDIVQEVFFDLVRRIRSGALEQVDTGWVIVAVRHRYIDSLRRRRREERRVTQMMSAHLTTIVDPGDSRMDESMARLLGRLPDAQRVALILHHVDGLSISDVAALLDRSAHATESLLARGRTRLRRLLEEDERE